MDVSHHSTGNTQEAHLRHHPKQSISSKIRSQTRMSRLFLHFLCVLIFGLLEVLARATWQLKEIKGRHLTKARVQARVLLEDGILPYPKYSWGMFAISLSSFLRHGPVCTVLQMQETQRLPSHGTENSARRNDRANVKSLCMVTVPTFTQ